MTGNRICPECTTPSMDLRSRDMKIYNTELRYQCTTCGEEATLVPLSSIGVNTTVGFLALAIWGTILFWDIAGPGIIGLSIFAIAVLAWAGIAFSQFAAHYRYPLSETEERGDIPAPSENDHAAQGLIVWIESLGVVAGFFAPVFLIAVVLGAATLIGYINFTYFS